MPIELIKGKPTKRSFIWYSPYTGPMKEKVTEMKVYELKMLFEDLADLNLEYTLAELEEEIRRAIQGLPFMRVITMSLHKVDPSTEVL